MERDGEAQTAGQARAAEATAGPAGLGNQLVQRLMRRGDGAADPATASRSLQRVVTGSGARVPFNGALQRAFGRHDVGGLVAHTGPQASEAASAWGARALATGRHVVFSGAPSLREAAHEAAHAVQQRHLSGSLSRAATADCEAHADAVADAVGRGDSAEPLLDAFAARGRGWGAGSPGEPASRRTRRGRSGRLGAAPVQFIVDATNDAQIHYNQTIDRQRGHMHLLRKAKGLYSEKEKNDQNLLATLARGRAVEVLDEADGGSWKTRSWAKVRATVDGAATTGYINTKGGVDDKPLVHAAAGVVMDPDNGPKPEDVAQNMFGDCYLLAPLMSMARRMPDRVRSGLFQTNPTQPADTHTIRFHRETAPWSGVFVAEDVRVANTVLQTQADMVRSDGSALASGSNIGANGGWNWPALVEKAFAAWPGKRGRGTLDGGDAGWGASLLIGQTHATPTLSMTADEQQRWTNEEKGQFVQGKKAAILAAVTAGDRLVTASTKGQPPQAWLDRHGGKTDGTGAGSEKKVGGIAFGHVYDVVSATHDEIRVRNPWGSYGRVDGQKDDRAAVSVLTWDEFMAVFACYETRAG